MNPLAQQGLGLAYLLVIILYFVSRKKGGRWTTIFRIVAWWSGISTLYYILVTSGTGGGGHMLLPATVIYLTILIGLFIISLFRRKKSEVWKIGFWVLLIVLIFNAIGLLLFLSSR